MPCRGLNYGWRTSVRVFRQSRSQHPWRVREKNHNADYDISLVGVHADLHWGFAPIEPIGEGTDLRPFDDYSNSHLTYGGFRVER